MQDELSHSIAIVGMAGMFPGSSDIQKFWENICQGTESISTFSEEQLLKSGVSKSTINSPKYVRSKGVIEGVDLFDANFFGFNQTEAAVTDPQHRLFLECAFTALENAGYDPAQFPGSIGIYAGSGPSTYYLNNIHPHENLRESLGDYLLQISNEKDFLTTRASYKLGCKGPSLNIQTACSTSLVSVCIACNHLLTYECDMALAGGVSIPTPQEKGYSYQEGMIFSPDGHCRPFDAKAKGTIQGSGLGVVVLKRFTDAIKDRDHIYALIKGYGLNNDADCKSTFSAPSVEGQKKAILSALGMADVPADTIGFTEAHGTGTLLGDPIEFQALKEAHLKYSEKKGYCAIGSVKGNIGHLMESSGIAGLIKATLAVKEGYIPPSINFDSPNPHIDFENSPFFVNKELKKWDSLHPRRAAISAFGIGGTNAHVIVQEAPKLPGGKTNEGPVQIFLSAKTKTALKKMATNLAEHLKKNTEISLVDVAYTLRVGRKKFEHTFSCITKSKEEAIDLLLNFKEINGHCAPSEGRRIPLPAYPFEKERYWIDPPEKKDTIFSANKVDLQSALISNWKSLLGLEQIDIDEDFFKIGGDSLMAIQFVSYVQKTFNDSFHLQDFLQNSTIRKLKELFLDKPKVISNIIVLKEGTNKSPLFCIHPIEGTLFCYKELIKALETKSIVYGILGDESKQTIEEIASHYIKQIKEKQPEGPYRLLGYSFGGIIAYEIAQQLGKENIALLTVIDSLLEGVSSNEEEALYQLTSLLGTDISFQDFQKLVERDRRDLLMDQLGLGSMDSAQQRHIHAIIKNFIRAIINYRPKHYEGEMVVFEADNGQQTLLSGWEKYAKAEFYKLDANHKTVLDSKQMGVVSKFLRERIG